LSAALRIAVLSNPRSRQNRQGGVSVAESVARHPGTLHRVIGDVAEIPAALTGFAREGAGLIAIDGGDGTVQAVLTAALLGGAFADAPRFAIIPSGTTNLTALDLGMRERGGVALDRLAACVAAGEVEAATVRRPALRLERGAAGPPVLGFFFGAGIIRWGTDMTLGTIEAGRFGNRLSATVGVAVGALRLMFEGPSSPLRQGEPMGLGLDGAPPREGRRLLVLATSLPRLMFGMNPFWGEGSGALRWLDVAAPGRRFAAAVLPLLRGRPRPWMAAAGYASGRAGRIDLVLRHPIRFDGQAYDPPADGRVSLAADRTVAFVRP
jgi:diacylglycerol kinase-like protein